MIKNYALFEKYLSKISKTTIDKFNSKENIVIFLEEICNTGHERLAVKKIAITSPLISPLLLHKIIRSDRHLSKCVSLAKNQAVEIAEAVLFDRAKNGYEEVTYNKNGECVTRKKKYCSKSLLEFLKANSEKYQSKTIEKINAGGKHEKDKGQKTIEMGNFKIESYEADNED